MDEIKEVETSTDIANQILESDSLPEIKQLTHLFNLNQNKKEALRILALNNSLDKVYDEMAHRVEDFPGSFSNKDLLEYVNTIQKSIDRSSVNLNLIDESPSIIPVQQNNTQINVNINSADRYTRERVYQVLENLLTDNIDTEDIDVDV